MTPNTRIVAVIVVLAASTAGAFVMTGPSVGASFTAGDVETTTHDGEIDAVTIAPAGEVSWTGLEAQPKTATVTVQVQTADGWTVLASQTYGDVDGLDGSLSYDFSERGQRIDLTKRPFSDDRFTASDGESSATTIDIRIVATVAAQEDRRTTVSDSFTVRVANKPADTDASGRAGTGVSSSSEVDD